MSFERTNDGRSTVCHDLVVAAGPAELWSAIIDPERAPDWMGGFRLVSRWEVGGALAVIGSLDGRPYEERGTLLAFEPRALLRYDHWSPLWRVPDALENRAVLELRLDGRGPMTRLAFRHALPPVDAIAEHSDFFWGVALARLKILVESRPPGAP